MRKHVRLLLACLLLAASACSGEREATPGADVGIKLDEPPQRIVSLIPSITETIVALGAADRLVARSDFDTDPALAHLPSVGQGLTPSLEGLTMLEPDLVIAWPDNASRSVIDRLAELGVTVYTPQIQTLADIERTTRELGDMLGLKWAAASLVAATDAELDAIERAVAGHERLTVFYVVWYEPPTTTGAGTYVDELIEIAGGRNIFEDAPGLWPTVSLEEVLNRQPDIVLLSYTEEIPVDAERLRAAPGWRDLQAVRDGRVLQIDANLYNRPGPRVTEAARQLARLLHPEAFQDGA
ncbi:MAG: cobalamin-binding protein [Gemmatimonadota bacterium]|nr:MAG: cobalamin-binding protein [Gemmatimonadota bacterium]